MELIGFCPGRELGDEVELSEKGRHHLAGIVAPIITGWLKSVTGSYMAPMQTIWVVLIVGVAAYLFLAKEPRTPVSGHNTVAA